MLEPTTALRYLFSLAPPSIAANFCATKLLPRRPHAPVSPRSAARRARTRGSAAEDARLVCGSSRITAGGVRYRTRTVEKAFEFQIRMSFSRQQFMRHRHRILKMFRGRSTDKMMEKRAAFSGGADERGGGGGKRVCGGIPGRERWVLGAKKRKKEHVVTLARKGPSHLYNQNYMPTLLPPCIRRAHTYRTTPTHPPPAARRV